MDDNIIYATAQSEPLPVDLGAGHSVAASRLQLVSVQLYEGREKKLLLRTVRLQAIPAAMQAAVDGDADVLTESLMTMTKALETIIASMETLKS